MTACQHQGCQKPAIWTATASIWAQGMKGRHDPLVVALA